MSSEADSTEFLTLMLLGKEIEHPYNILEPTGEESPCTTFQVATLEPL